MRNAPPIASPDAILAYDLLDPLTEVCDVCGTLIRNFKWMLWSFVTEDGRIVCNNCRPKKVEEKS